MEIIIILLLILLNGVFAMAEIAIVSARKARLQKLANEGDENAKAALSLAKSPNRFLSTVQIGITFVGIFAGAFGGDTIARSLSETLQTVPFIAPYSTALSLFLVVAIITFLSLVIGELVPKRVALNSPERIARIVARPMNVLSRLASPLVSLLTLSTDGILKVLRVKPSDEPTVSTEEIRLMIREGARSGILDMEERDIVERTFKLGDRKVNTLMTPRKEIVWLDVDSSFRALRSKITKHPHSHFPVCRGDLDRVLGVTRTEDLLSNFLKSEKVDLKASLHNPVFIPESMEALKVLELFKKTGIHMALIIDEYGGILGLISLDDILSEIVGDIPSINELEEQEIVKRDNGTYLVDGLLPIDEFKEYFHIGKLAGERTGTFHTVGGYVMMKLGRIPTSGDIVETKNYKFEVVDMDENRIDKIHLSPLKKTTKPIG